MSQLLVSVYGFYPEQKEKFKKLMKDSGNASKEVKDGIYEFSGLTKNEIHNLINDLKVWEKRYGFELNLKITHRKDQTDESKRTLLQRISILEKRIGVKESRVSIREAYKKLPSDERNSKFDFFFNFKEWEPRPFENPKENWDGWIPNFGVFGIWCSKFDLSQAVCKSLKRYAKSNYRNKTVTFTGVPFKLAKELLDGSNWYMGVDDWEVTLSEKY